MSEVIKQWNPLDGTIKAWNRILLQWDNLPKVCLYLDYKIYPIWIRLSDNKRFQTPKD